MKTTVKLRYVNVQDRNSPRCNNNGIFALTGNVKLLTSPRNALTLYLKMRKPHEPCFSHLATKMDLPWCDLFCPGAPDCDATEAVAGGGTTAGGGTAAGGGATAGGGEAAEAEILGSE